MTNARTPIQVALDGIEWQECPPPQDPKQLHAVRQGVLTIADMRLRCYVLSDGQRVFDADDLMEALGGPE